MRRPVLSRLLLTAVLVVTGCGTIDSQALSPSNLKIEIRSDNSVYAPEDTFSGTFTFINRSRRRIRASFPSWGQYWVDFYDDEGILRLGWSDNVGPPAVSYLELEPLGTRTDTLRIPLAGPPDSLHEGTYRVHAWVDRHEDIYSETTIEVR